MDLSRFWSLLFYRIRMRYKVKNNNTNGAEDIAALFVIAHMQIRIILAVNE